MKVPFLELYPAYDELRNELDAAYHKVMDSGWYLLGNETKEFESEFADFCGTKYAVTVANGLDALRLSLLALDIGVGDEVIVPANTFIATFLAVSQTGATPIPVEPCSKYYNINPVLIEKAISSRTKAIIPVHLYGQCADMAPILDIAKRYNLKVIEDSAQAHGAVYNGKKAGNLGDIACFSFYPGKNLGAFSDSGAITTNDENVDMKVRSLRNYGSTVKYHHDDLGCNSRSDELQSAFLRIKLKYIESWNSRRREIAKRYQEELSNLPIYTVPAVASNNIPVWHIFPLMTPCREKVQKELSDAGIQALIHYPIPAHLSGAYESLKYSQGDFPVAEKLSEEELSLPIGPHLNMDQVDYVIETLKGIAKNN